jgi:hypothetical protein
MGPQILKKKSPAEGWLCGFALWQAAFFFAYHVGTYKEF